MLRFNKDGMSAWKFDWTKGMSLWQQIEMQAQQSQLNLSDIRECTPYQVERRALSRTE